MMWIDKGTVKGNTGHFSVSFLWVFFITLGHWTRKFVTLCLTAIVLIPSETVPAFLNLKKKMQ